MNRAQIERAERVATLMADKALMRRLTEVRVEAELPDDEWERYEKEQSRLVEQRLRYYESHTVKMERERAVYLAQMIESGLMDSGDAFMVVEAHKPTGRKRIPNTQKTFTARQMEIATRSLENRASA